MSHLEIIKNKEEVLLVNENKLFMVYRIETTSGQVFWYHSEKDFTQEESAKLEVSYKISKRNSIIEGVLK
jgi:hypothetical protein